MKNKKFILFTITLLLCVITITKTSITSYALFHESDFKNELEYDEFYETDYHVFKKGYYILVGEGDISHFTFSGNIKSYLYKGSNLTISTFESTLGVEEKYKENLTNCISSLNRSYSSYPEEQAFLIRVDNYGLMIYGDGPGCWECNTFGVETYNDSSTKTDGRYHVLNVDSRLTVEQILAKYTFTDNVDSKENISVNYITPYNNTGVLGAFPIYIEVSDKSGNISTIVDYIYVHDFVAPKILTDKDTYEIEVNTVLTSDTVKGYFKVTDNFSNQYNITNTFEDGYKSQYNKIGQYSITCTSKDYQGNSSSKTISIKVVDTTKPTIALKDGGDTIYSNKELSTSEIYNLLNIQDNYDNITESQVSITTNCTGLEGVQYNIDVSVTDSSNNTASKTFNYYINDTTAPNITVRDTVYLDINKNYTSEEILAILKAAGIISNDATTVNFIEEELISSNKNEDTYKLTYEEILADGTINYGFATLKYQKENNNYIYYIIASSILMMCTSTLLIIKKIKKRKASKLI